jgi:low temperature requirement protein LtrA
MLNIKYFDSNRHTTWLEAFFDLIFAVTIADVTHILSHTHEGHLDPLQFWKFVLLFIPLWWINVPADYHLRPDRPTIPGQL